MYTSDLVTMAKFSNWYNYLCDCLMGNQPVCVGRDRRLVKSTSKSAMVWSHYNNPQVRLQCVDGHPTTCTNDFARLLWVSVCPHETSHPPCSLGLFRNDSEREDQLILLKKCLLYQMLNWLWTWLGKGRWEKHIMRQSTWTTSLRFFLPKVVIEMKQQFQ